MKRIYSGKPIHIDGRDIPYELVTAMDYLLEKNVDGLKDKKSQCNNENDATMIVENWVEENYPIYERLTQIMALKQSCFLLRHTSHSCGSLSDGLYYLKNELIKELKDKYDFIFDDEFVEEFRYSN